MLYQEIANQYIKFIKLGVFKYGDKLPSVRQIASELGINPNTVNKSFQVLEEGRYIKVYPKKGAFVVYNLDVDTNKINYVTTQIAQFKNNGVKKDELLSIVNEVYGGEE